MLSLSNLKFDLIKVLRVLGLILGTILIIYIMFRIGVAVKEIIRPSPPTPPAAKFGKLPPVSFPQSATSEKISYQIDTLSGNVPSFPHLINVYSMESPQAELLALERANEKAQSVGFKESGKKITDEIYEWKSENPPLSMRLNIRNNDFQLFSNLSSTSAFLTNPDSEEESIDKATQFLNSMSLFYQDLDSEKTQTYYYSIDNGELREATSLSRAQVLKIHFFQKDVNDLPLYYPEGKSPMNLLTGYNGRIIEVLSGSFFYQTPDLDSGTTYTIKTGQEAFEELKNGKAYIARYSLSSENVLIKDVFLGYYIGSEKQSYLMPIYIFEGNDFLAYVPAITDEWIEN